MGFLIPSTWWLRCLYIYIPIYTFLFHLSHASVELKKGLRNMRKQMELDSIRYSGMLLRHTTLRRLVSLRCLVDRIEIILFFQVCTLNSSAESGSTDYNTVTGYTRCISKIPFCVRVLNKQMPFLIRISISSHLI